jgi:hypothetical protein
MTILQEGKSVKIPVIFSREATDTHNRKTIVYLQKSVSVSVWNVKEFSEFKLKLMKGHSGRFVRVDKDSPQYAEPMLKLFLWVPNESGGSQQEIDGFSGIAKYEGISIEISNEETVISAKEASAKINRAEVMYLNEDLSKRTIDV